jgi:hypothetical protein
MKCPTCPPLLTICDDCRGSGHDMEWRRAGGGWKLRPRKHRPGGMGHPLVERACRCCNGRGVCADGCAPRLAPTSTDVPSLFVRGG